MCSMKKFTYYDYLRYTRNSLSDVSETYQIGGIHQYKDKGFKVILEEKEEACQVINKALGIESTRYEVKKEEIEKYNSNFITQNFMLKQADIVYKKKGEDIFFLIEHQSTVDYSMPYRLLNYCIEIIREAVVSDLLKTRDYKIPVVYPIVLYTGKRKWNVEKYFEECQMRLKGVGKTNFTDYNLIDIHDYTEEELWKEKNFLSKILLLEKAKQSDNIEKYLNEISLENFTDKELNVLLKMVKSSLTEKEDKILAYEAFLKEMKKKRGGINMLTALEEYVQDLWAKKSVGLESKEKEIESKQKEIESKEKEVESKEKEVESKQKEVESRKKELENKIKEVKESKMKIVVRMIENQMDEKTIKLMTEITQEELERIKRKSKV